MPCNDWLGLAHYKSDSFKSKTVWFNQELSAMMHAKKQALKFINKSNQHNKCQTASKELVIPIGNHILLCDHPEGHNKIQNRFKSMMFISWLITMMSLTFITSNF